MSERRLSQASADLLAELRENNNRTWFQENRDRVEALLLIPAREMIVEVGELLRRKRPDIIADPRTDRSIYRLNRDTRFSRDKTPYKTHLAMWWWEGMEGRLECPGFYLHFTPESLGISVGCYRFSEAGLAGWRTALSDPKKAAAFRRLVGAEEKRGQIFSEPELKRTPAGLSPDHPMAEYMRHKGFYSWNEEFPHPPEIFGPDAAEYAYQRFEPSFKFHAWMVETLGSCL